MHQLKPCHLESLFYWTHITLLQCWRTWHCQ